PSSSRRGRRAPHPARLPRPCRDRRPPARCPPGRSRRVPCWGCTPCTPSPRGTRPAARLSHSSAPWDALPGLRSLVGVGRASLLRQAGSAGRGRENRDGGSAVATAARSGRRRMALHLSSPAPAVTLRRVPRSDGDDLERSALDERLHARMLSVVRRDLRGLQRTQVQYLSTRQRDAQRLRRCVPDRRRHATSLVRAALARYGRRPRHAMRRMRGCALTIVAPVRSPEPMPLIPLALRRAPLDVLACLAGEPGALLLEVPDPVHPVTLIGCRPVAELTLHAGDHAPLATLARFIAQ